MNFKDRLKKKKIWKSKVFWIIIVLIVAIIIAFFALKRKQMSNIKAALTSSVKSAEVTTGTISEDIEGSGTLAAADYTDVKIPVGITVDEVLVESGDQVTKGQKLAKLNKTSIISALVEIESSLDSIDDQLDDDDDLTDLEIEELKAERKEIKEAQTTLKALKKNPVITATSAGIVTSVNVSDDTETAQTSSSSSSSNAGSSMASYQSATSSSTKNVTATKVVATVTPLTGMVTYSADNDEIVAAKTASLTSDITATVSADDSSETSSDSTTESSDDSDDSDATTASTSTETDSSTSTSASTDTTESSSSSSSSSKSSSSSSANSNSASAYGSMSGKSSSAMSGISGSAASGLTSAASSAATSTASSSSSSIYSAYEMVGFEIASTDKVSVDVSVDELDILSVEEGQTATITLDALEDQEFEGTITKVSNISTSSSGNAKYTATIEMDMADDMRIGMTATATIHIDSAENVLVIPVAALQQTGDKTFVYTESDDDGNLSGEVEVETGLSDSSQVEIKSGLSEGDTVYYTRSGDDSSDFSFGDFGQMGGGDMPSGGEMPSGGHGNGSAPQAPGN